MKFALIVVSCVTALGVLAGCDAASETPDIPPQDYFTTLTALGENTGGVVGRILFPSEYNQRSTVFTLDRVSFVTYPDGRFWIRRVPAGQHWLLVAIKGFEPVRVPVQVVGGESRVLDPLRLTAARGRVLGRLVNEKGESAAGLEIQLTPSGGVAVTDNDGIFQFIGVPGGDHTLTLNDAAFFAANKHFRLTSNEQRNLGLITVHREITPQNRAIGQRE